MPIVTWFSFTSRLSTVNNILCNVYNLSSIVNFQRPNICFRKEHVTCFSSDKMATGKPELFDGKRDRFDGITVQSDKENCSDSEFQEKLEGIDVLRCCLINYNIFVGSLKYWRTNGNRGVWFNVHLKQAGWVPVLAQVSYFHNL